jgi:hypothetical protein
MYSRNKSSDEKPRTCNPPAIRNMFVREPACSGMIGFRVGMCVGTLYHYVGTCTCRYLGRWLTVVALHGELAFRLTRATYQRMLVLKNTCIYSTYRACAEQSKYMYLIH